MGIFHCEVEHRNKLWFLYNKNANSSEEKSSNPGWFNYRVRLIYQLIFKLVGSVVEICHFYISFFIIKGKGT